jgi:hypothetical protein
MPIGDNVTFESEAGAFGVTDAIPGACQRQSQTPSP